MDILNDIFILYVSGAPDVFAPRTLLMILAGTALGVIFGVLPGLTSTMALALFTPLTFGMTPAEAIGLLMAIYISSVYAGSITAILINIPGTPASIATGLDGYPLAKRGEAGRAISITTMASFIGGMVGLVVLMTFSPLLAGMARRFGSWEFALLAILALTLIAYVGSKSLVRGLIGGVIGLLIAAVGSDPMLSYPRFTFSTTELVGGINVIVVMIGLFGFAELFYQIENRAAPRISQSVSGLWSAIGEVRQRMRQISQGAVTGVLIGVLPGVGGAIASIAAYGIARRASKKPEEFGKGSTEGLAAAESATNASVGGALVPMMTMGIPGDPMTAVLIGALMIHGLAPGPSLYAEAPAFVSSVFLSYFVALVFMLVAGMMLARPFAWLIGMPRYIVLSVVAVLCVLGTYAIQNSVFDIGIAIAIGFAGYLLQKVDIQPAAICLGVVLGPILESNLRRAIFLGDGSLTPFFTRPLSLFLIVCIIVVLALPWISAWFKRMFRKTVAT